MSMIFFGWQFDLVKWDLLRKNPPTVTNYKHQTSCKFKKLPSRKKLTTPFNLKKKQPGKFPSHLEFLLFFQGSPFFSGEANPRFIGWSVKSPAPSSCMILGPKGLRRRCFWKSVNLRTVWDAPEAKPPVVVEDRVPGRFVLGSEEIQWKTSWVVVKTPCRRGVNKNSLYHQIICKVIFFRDWYLHS